jgi:hypothetical protein
MKIKIDYETGDSYSHQDVTEILEMEWQNLEIAKENLRRIKEHYLWYDYKNSFSWRRESLEAVPQPVWHNGKNENVIIIKLDDGSDFQMGAFWCGYFETLHGASIIQDTPDDTSFSLRQYE